jgi:hypothetical protein
VANPRRLTESQVSEVIKLSREGVSGVQIARMFGVSPQLISFVRKQGYKPVYKYRDTSQIVWEPTWAWIAEQYTLKNPDDPITTDTAHRTHEIAIRKLRAHFAQCGTQKHDLI